MGSTLDGLTTMARMNNTNRMNIMKVRYPNDPDMGTVMTITSIQVLRDKVRSLIVLAMGMETIITNTPVPQGTTVITTTTTNRTRGNVRWHVAQVFMA
jgi:hypothetical protein